MSSVLTPPKPRAFIGSSETAAMYAREIKRLLADDFDVRAWTDPGIFRPSISTIDSILYSLQRSDFGIFVLDADDLLESKGRIALATRDNVLFEAGLYFGARGASACFLFVPDIPDLHIASDLAGLTQLRFRNKDMASLAQKCDELKRFCVGDWRTPESIALTGRWTQSWEVDDSPNFPRQNLSEAYVALFGCRWVARHSVGNDIYTLEGDMRGQLITGRWFGPTEHHYHGVMQLALSPRLHKANGFWTGYRSDGSIASGRWLWERL